MIEVIVPALNEAENVAVVIPQIVAELDKLGGNHRVRVIDDGSTDDTAGVVRKLALEHPNVAVTSLGRNQGKAEALRRGFGLAVEDGADIVVMMDADGQDDPAELPKLLAELDKGPALVTGARYVRNDRFIKRTTSRLYNAVTRVMSGTPGRDFNSGFKVMRAGVAADIAPMLYGELHRYITVVAYSLGHQVAEVEVAHHPRLHGKTKYGIARFWRGFMDLLTIRFLLSYEHRPSHLFGGAGFFGLVLGGAILTYLVVLKVLGHSIGDRPLLLAGVLLVVVGLQLVLFGLLAELIVHARNQSRERLTR